MDEIKAAVHSSDQIENVLTFEKRALAGIGYFQGLSFDTDKYLHAIGKSYFYTDRIKAECSSDLKQLIPYAILIHNENVLRYKRGSDSGDLRLRSRHSIGIGGHISHYDGNMFPKLCFSAMIRELNEELFIKSSFQYKDVALINDDSNDVGRVHFGIIIIVKLDSANVVAKEMNIKEVEFVSIAELKKNIDSFESWSAICIENIESIFNAYHAVT